MTKEEINKRLEEYHYWYHKIELAPGLFTAGFDLDDLWEQTRKVRNNLEYRGKKVLDIASFDGLFTFEAEKLGAELVVAADCLYKSFNNFLFCREVLGSRAIPYYNISPYNLTSRLDVFLDENYEDEKVNDRLFDIVQHLGLLYHLRDPLLSLSQARSVLKTGGHLLIETDIVLEQKESFMLFNGLPKNSRVRDNYSVWWAPTKTCLFEMLESSMFEVIESSYSEFYFSPPAREMGKVSNATHQAVEQEDLKEKKIGRAAVVARAVPIGHYNDKFEREMTRTYRNPGLDMTRLEVL